MKKKLKSHSGMTLAESLVAIIILLLVSTIVMRGVPAAKSAYEKVVVGANARVMLTTAISALRNELSTAQRIENSSDKKSITYYSADRGATSKIYLSSGSGDDTAFIADTIMLKEYDDYKSAAEEAAATGIFDILQPGWEKTVSVVPSTKARALASSLEAQRGRADKLYVTYDSIVYDKTTKLITVTGLKVIRSTDNATLAQVGEPEIDNNKYIIRVIPNEAEFAPAAALPTTAPGDKP